MEAKDLNTEITTDVTPSNEAVAEVTKTQLVETEQLASMTREALFDYVTAITHDYQPSEINTAVEKACEAFDKKTADINAKKLEKFIADGGKKEDFAPSAEEIEKKMKSLHAAFREKRKAQIEANEKVLAQNALVKRNVIENIQKLLETGDCMANLNEFKELMATWKKTGPVPRHQAKEINGAYKKVLDEYFANLNINRELRNLDMKKNLEEKTHLCERAEELIDTPTPGKAFSEIKHMQNQWRSIGPVPKEQREEIWQRFKTAVDAVAQKYFNFESTQKDREEDNYQAKLLLCQEIEGLQADFKTLKEAEEVIKKVQDIQERWRKIGFAPKEFNDEIYARFRKTCDELYERRRTVLKAFTGDMENNLKLKTALCEKAESLSDSTDWKSTTDAMIDMQKKWKTIGAVPRKHSDALWKRFRAACDKFFEAKKEHFNEQDGSMTENLEKKQALIAELKALELAGDEKDFEVLQGFQRRWNEIGFVPMKNKAEVNSEFAKLIDTLYDKISVDESERSMQRFRTKMALMLEESDGKNRLNGERNRLINKLKQMEADIINLQNNVGFFAKSKNSDSLVADVNHKIDNAKKNIEMINLKLDVIDKLL